MQDEEVRAFKNELRNYTYYLSRIVTLENSIEFLYDRLGGVRGIDPSKEPLHAMPNKEMEWKLRDDISKLEAKKKRYENHLTEIERILGRMEPTLRWAVIEVYAKNNTIESVARKLFLSHNGLARRMDKEIKKALY